MENFLDMRRHLVENIRELCNFLPLLIASSGTGILLLSQEFPHRLNLINFSTVS